MSARFVRKNVSILRAQLLEGTANQPDAGSATKTTRFSQGKTAHYLERRGLRKTAIEEHRKGAEEAYPVDDGSLIIIIKKQENIKSNMICGQLKIS